MEYLLFTEQDILERVDEYTLYCFYLKYEPLIGAKYCSPKGLRRSIGKTDDDKPSWGVYEAKKRLDLGVHEFVWKDGATGDAGNIFKLVQRLYGYETKLQGARKVCADFGLGGAGINPDKPLSLEVVPKKYADPVDIQISSRAFLTKELAWWKQFNIEQSLLTRYTTTALKCYWIAKEQQVPSYPSGGMGFAYREWDKYQLYFPLAAKEKKFRNNFTEACVHGFKQLQRDTDTLIITKSRKDVMCLRSFGYESISPTAENTPLPEACMKLMREWYPNRLILFDNDMKHGGHKYPEPKIYVPQTLREDDKDPSDFCKHHGPQQTAEMLKTIIYGGIKI